MMNPLTKFLGAFFLLIMATFPIAYAGSYTESNIDSYLAELKAKHESDAEKRGLEIYTQQYLIDEGWKSMSTTMEMELIDANGNSSTRTVIKQTLEEEKSPDKTLGIFVAPNDIKGTVMLTFEHEDSADSQWLYMPAIKRTKKINAKNKSGSFIGSEFSWEDISTTELTKYTYKLLDETETHWVVERVPSYEFSGYSKQKTKVNKANYQTEEIEFFDKKGDLLKTLVLTDWREYDGGYWRPKHFEMKNLQNGKTTILKLSDYELGVAEKRNFTSLNLSRIEASIN